MYTIERSKGFEKSFQRLARSGIKISAKEKVLEVINLIATSQNLSEHFGDHALHGEYQGYRECHIQNDLLLIYKIEKENLVLILMDIGSHSQLFG